MPYNKKRHIDTESDEEQQVVKKAKSQKQAKKDLSKGTDAEGNPYWEVGSNRRIGVSQFKGATLVNIREYYTAPDGELRPGKKVGSTSRAFRCFEDFNQQFREFRSPWNSTTPSSRSFQS